jgi:hypothetical protein
MFLPFSPFIPARGVELSSRGESHGNFMVLAKRKQTVVAADVISNKHVSPERSPPTGPVSEQILPSSLSTQLQPTTQRKPD